MEDRYLFRAKRIDNWKWVVGYYTYYPDGMNNTKDTKSVIRDTSVNPNKLYFVDPSTICKCTGLKDKNGKLIWENDICDRKEIYPEIVKYHEGDWTLDYSYVSGNGKGFNFCNLGFYVHERKCVEVIGNVFDNPELLKYDFDLLKSKVKRYCDDKR